MTVIKLRPDGFAVVERERLDQLYAQLGAPAAESVVSRAMEELAVRLARLHAVYVKNDLEETRKAARSMVAISEQIGLTTFAQVAEDVSALALSDDGAALAATVERLLRIGENSLLAVWDLQGASL